MANGPVSLRVALAQLNPTVGDIAANASLCADAIADARRAGAGIVVLPELVLTGYPPEDLLLKEHFVAAARMALDDLAASVEGIVALVGCPIREDGLHNALAVLAEGSVAAVYRKVLLPNEGVFDERRYFVPGPGGAVIDVGDARIGLTVCEDVWWSGPPTSAEAAAGASLVVNASASPYFRGRGAFREGIVAERARENGVAMALCNMVGGQDELVFDGHSVIVDAAGETVARAGQFEEELLLCDLDLPASRSSPSADDGAPTLVRLSAPERSGAGSEPLEPIEPRLAAPLTDPDEVYAALVLGLRDYAGKNGFEHAVLGLSGGIDSALVALLAADAIGPERVSCVIMPSPHSSDATQGDARLIASNLGCEAIEFDIAPLMAAYERVLAERFEGTAAGVAEENLQARIRGNLVMALSNKLGWLPLSTGNKSEMSVGYATLYGDMAGGFAVIKDVPKLLVYALVERRNEAAGRELVPASVIERPPSAELRPDQLDTDSLPPYELLDPALESYVERDGSRESMSGPGIDAAVAERVAELVDRAEYKRRQAPPGVKITAKAFGRDRRLPITNRFRG
jgi:NAD+ synthase (glutamine-hydrolysing)